EPRSTDRRLLDLVEHQLPLAPDHSVRSNVLEGEDDLPPQRPQVHSPVLAFRAPRLRDLDPLASKLTADDLRHRLHVDGIDPLRVAGDAADVRTGESGKGECQGEEERQQNSHPVHLNCRSLTVRSVNRKPGRWASEKIQSRDPRTAKKVRRRERARRWARGRRRAAFDHSTRSGGKTATDPFERAAVVGDEPPRARNRRRASRSNARRRLRRQSTELTLRLRRGKPCSRRHRGRFGSTPPSRARSLEWRWSSASSRPIAFCWAPTGDFLCGCWLPSYWARRPSSVRICGRCWWV